MIHSRFLWDSAKAAANRRRHGVNFETAAEVLADRFAEQFQLHQQQERRGESRCLTLASHPARRSIVLAIVWARREDRNGPITRIISARKATRLEREQYEKEAFQDHP